MPVASRLTSGNRVSKGLKELVNLKTSTNLDFGGGRFDTGTQWLEEKGITNIIFDPYNRSYEQNTIALLQPYDSVTILNVLNVVPNKSERKSILYKALQYTNSFMLISVYQGNRSGVTSQSHLGYQLNQKLDFYEKEILQWRIPVQRYKDFLIYRRENDLFT